MLESQERLWASPIEHVSAALLGCLWCHTAHIPSMQSFFLLYETCDPYAVFVFISIASPFIFLLVHTSSYTVIGSASELGLCDDSLDLLEM